MIVIRPSFRPDYSYHKSNKTALIYKMKQTLKIFNQFLGFVLFHATHLSPFIGFTLQVSCLYDADDDLPQTVSTRTLSLPQVPLLDQ